MVSKEVVESYHNIMEEFAPFAEQGWLCEGGSDKMGRLRNIIFNNETTGYVSADYSGRVYVYENVDEKIAKKMADIVGRARSLLVNNC